MEKAFFFQGKVATLSGTSELGVFFLFYEKIIWINYSKKRFLCILPRKNLQFFWKRSIYRNELEIRRQNRHLISFFGFPDQRFSTVKFFLEKFNLKITYPITNQNVESFKSILFPSQFSIFLLSKAKKPYARKPRNFYSNVRKNLFSSYLDELFFKRKEKYRKNIDILENFIYKCSKKNKILFTNFYFKKKKKEMIFTFLEKSFSKIMITSKSQISFFSYENCEIFVRIKKKKNHSFMFNTFVSDVYKELVFKMNKKEEIKGKQNIFTTQDSSYFIKIYCKSYVNILLSFFYQKSGKSYDLDFQLKN